MEDTMFAGVLLRILRLEKNWSQETLCKNICAVSYLSKIEQGRAEPNPQLLQDLFSRLGVSWQDSPALRTLRDALYEDIFSWNESGARQKLRDLEGECIGPCYPDFLVMRAFLNRSPDLVPNGLQPLLNNRQGALYALSRNQHEKAFHIYPCPLTAFCVGEEAFQKGNYIRALEYFQMACDQAAREGYVFLQMYSQHYMSNCYSEMGNLDAMVRHGRIAQRMGCALGDHELVRIIGYNIAATKAEFGDYQGAYDYFAALENPTILDLHKLSVCCEALGLREEALSVLDKADSTETELPLERQMCALVRYRLEHPGYLSDNIYGQLLMDTFGAIQSQLHHGFARFHLRWVTEWLTANRQYRKAYELLRDFPENRS